jgi:hypothetical protein
LEIALRQLNLKAFPSPPSPLIGLDAADKSLNIVIDLDERSVAAVADVTHYLVVLSV